MSRRQNFWLWIIGLPLFLGVAAHWGFHFYVSSQLDRLIGELRPELEIRYGEMESNLLGVLQVRGIRISGARLASPLLIDRLDVRGPTIFTYLLYNNPVTGSGPPRFLRLLASGMRMELPPEGPGQGDECDLREGIPASLLRKLGFTGLQGEASASYRYRPELHLLEGSVNLDIDGIKDLALEVKLQNVTPLGFRRGQLGTAALSELLLKLDVLPTFGKRLVEHCANRNQLTPAAFESVLVKTLLHRLEQEGVIPGPDLEAALERYVQNWGSLEVSLLPPVPMNLVFLPFVPNEQLQRKLGIEVLINGKAVEGMRLGEVKRMAAAHRPEPKPGRRLKLVRKGWLFQEVDPSRLSRYLGHRVRLQERGDPVRTGLLVEVDNGQAVVQQRLSGGKFMAYLSLADLVKAEVFVLKELVKRR